MKSREEKRIEKKYLNSNAPRERKSGWQLGTMLHVVFAIIAVAGIILVFAFYNENEEGTCFIIGEVLAVVGMLGIAFIAPIIKLFY